ncbi:hypothetical protein [Synoicihabitans lomoniglobus]|uniref:Uncharacterized protein n=1 Tax=Synoicihabitans lomoniglobus TaxID=2909285 RepID=A0AAE9ZXH7_9BACT|nr:hypothetical protein [Opitutaceae bacterium LMO-M01]WED64919.1 hypothetical protein PXH66_21440 [Opitutaceae bacterium LMO-M01]
MAKKTYILGVFVVLVLGVVAFRVMDLFRVRPEPASIEDFVATVEVPPDAPFVWDTANATWSFDFKNYEYLKGTFKLSRLKLKLRERLYTAVDLKHEAALTTSYDPQLLEAAKTLREHLAANYGYTEAPDLSRDLSREAILFPTHRVTTDRSQVAPGERTHEVFFTLKGDAVWGGGNYTQRSALLDQAPASLPVAEGEPTPERWFYYPTPDDDDEPGNLNNNVLAELVRGIFKGRGGTDAAESLPQLLLLEELAETTGSEIRYRAATSFESLWRGEPARTFFGGENQPKSYFDIDAVNAHEILDTFAQEVSDLRTALHAQAVDELNALAAGIEEQREAGRMLRDQFWRQVNEEGFVIAQGSGADDLLITFEGQNTGEMRCVVVALGGEFESVTYRLDVGLEDYFVPDVLRSRAAYDRLFALSVPLGVSPGISRRFPLTPAERSPVRLQAMESSARPRGDSGSAVVGGDAMPLAMELTVTAAEPRVRLGTTDGSYQLELGVDRSRYLSRLKAALETLAALKSQHREQVDGLDEKRQELLGPIGTEAILAGTFTPKQGAAAQAVLMQVVGFAEAVNQQGVFDLEVLMREPGNLHNAVVATGQIDLSADTDGILRRYFAAEAKLGELTRHERTIAAIFETLEPATDGPATAPWEPDPGAWAIDLRALAARVGSTEVTSRDDPRLLMNISRQRLAGETVATTLQVDAVAGETKQAYFEALQNMDRMLRRHRIWLSDDRQITLELTDHQPRRGMFAVELLQLERGDTVRRASVRGLAGPVITPTQTVERRMELTTTSGAQPWRLAVNGEQWSSDGQTFQPAPAAILNLHDREQVGMVHRISAQWAVEPLAEAVKIEGFTSGLGMFAKAITTAAVGVMAVSGENSSATTVALLAGGAMGAADESERQDRLKSATDEATRINGQFSSIGLGGVTDWRTLDPHEESLIFGRKAFDTQPYLYRLRRKGKNYEVADTLEFTAALPWTSQVVEYKLPPDLEPGHYLVTTGPVVVEGSAFPFQVTSNN